MELVRHYIFDAESIFPQVIPFVCEWGKPRSPIMFSVKFRHWAFYVLVVVRCQYCFCFFAWHFLKELLLLLWVMSHLRGVRLTNQRLVMSVDNSKKEGKHSHNKYIGLSLNLNVRNTNISQPTNQFSYRKSDGTWQFFVPYQMFTFQYSLVS